MQILKPTIVVYHDTRRSKTTELYPLKLRVTYAREQKYYSLGIDLSKQDFELIQNQTAIKLVADIRQKRKLQDIRLTYDTVIVKANKITEKLVDFTFDKFEKLFFQQEQSKTDVYSYYETTISQQIKDGRIGTASNYQCSLASLKDFSPKLNFRDVTTQFLKNYEKWLLDNGKSVTTVGIYLRPLRAILNTAIADGIISREYHYPFGKRLYQIPATRNKKKALTMAEMKKIYDYHPLPDTWWAKAKDFFLFSYLSNGMNMKDILLLRRKNMDGDHLRFIRAKTQFTHRSNNTPVSVFISPELRIIIETWQTSNIKEDDFLFPFLSKNLSLLKQQAAVQQFTKMVNKYLCKIVKEVGIDKKVTTYFARHSFATILKRNGVSTEIISESLGHSNIKTTASYLDSFDDETRKRVSEILVKF